MTDFLNTVNASTNMTQQTKVDWLVVDSSNMIYRSFLALDSSEISASDITPGLLHHTLFTVLYKYYRMVNPYPELSVSGAIYKGNRRNNLTPAQQQKYEKLYEYMGIVEQTLRDVTSLICMANDGLEADDIISGIVHKFGHDTNITILSGDKDFIQLLINDRIKLLDPSTSKYRELPDGGVDYFLLEKCFRGDSGDNVHSSYPRIRATRIKKAFHDPFEFECIMNETWIDHNGKTILVRDAYEENELLMNLQKQPTCILNKIDNCIDTSMNNIGKFTLFHFLKYCGKYKLNKVSEKIEMYSPMLAL